MTPPTSPPSYAICFDFPESDGTPMFAWQNPGEPYGLTASLENAAQFEEEEIAERVLRNSFGPSIRECGTVVEVAP
jgi:hypothetical protein